MSAVPIVRSDVGRAACAQMSALQMPAQMSVLPIAPDVDPANGLLR
jgi:hypothetical protein